MGEENRSAHVSRGGAREARRAARAQRKAVKLPYIRRRLPVIDLLSPEAVEIIEANAETILEEIGIEFRRDPESLRLWRGAGADGLDGAGAGQPGQPEAAGNPGPAP